MNPGPQTRRRMLQLSAAGLGLGAGSAGWFRALAAEGAKQPGRKRACILLWMNGGPSQLDTLDPKPGHANSGATKAIPTAVPGIQIAEYLPEIAKEMKHLALVRSMSTKEADHGRATHLLRTGVLPQGAVRYPALGAALAKELARPGMDLPSFVSILPFRAFAPEAYGPGFLGAKHAPLIVGDGVGFGPNAAMDLKVADLAPAGGVDGAEFARRTALLAALDEQYVKERPAAVPTGRRTATDRAVRLMNSSAAKAFDLDRETGVVRDRYGRTPFGQGCLLARRLVEAGVPFVEVTLSGVPGAPAGWDMHQDIFAQMRAVSGVLDKAWASLVRDLRERGLLDTTTIVWMGEFGRTPKLSNGGRDHFATAWSAALGGGGVKGGQVHGATTASGDAVKDSPVSAADFLATVCKAVGVDPGTQNDNDDGRPIRLVDLKAKPLAGILT